MSDFDPTRDEAPVGPYPEEETHGDPDDESPPEPPAPVLPPNPVVFVGMNDKGEQIKEPYTDQALAIGQNVQPANGALVPYSGELPDDIERTWGGGRVDGTGEPAISTARNLIGAWGLERFRASGLHQLAVQENERDVRQDPVRKAFVEAYRKKQKESK